MISAVPRECASKLTSSGQRASWNTNSLCGADFARLLLLGMVSIRQHNDSLARTLRG